MLIPSGGSGVQIRSPCAAAEDGRTGPRDGGPSAVRKPRWRIRARGTTFSFAPELNLVIALRRPGRTSGSLITKAPSPTKNSRGMPSSNFFAQRRPHQQFRPLLRGGDETEVPASLRSLRQQDLDCFERGGEGARGIHRPVPPNVIRRRSVRSRCARSGRLSIQRQPG